jgi:hypothetical protein
VQDALAAFRARRKRMGERWGWFTAWQVLVAVWFLLFVAVNLVRYVDDDVRPRIYGPGA